MHLVLNEGSLVPEFRSDSSLSKLASKDLEAMEANDSTPTAISTTA
jgi:hypothetical protein